MAAPTLHSALELPLLTHAGRRVTRATAEVTAVDGSTLARLSLAPDLLLSQTLAAQGRARALPADERAVRLADAAERFRSDDVGPVSYREHVELVSAASGHGPRVAAAATEAVAQAIAEAPHRADRGRPVGSVRSWEDAVTTSGRGVWARRGETLAAVLAGNSPTIQNGWLQALALGYRVAVRPSRREPFTALRVITALRAAGFRDVDAVFLPTDHGGAAALLRRADLGFVYGGDDVARRYADTSTVKVAGPGRSKALLTGTVSDATVEALADAASSGSGAGCVNTTGVYVAGDHIALAERVAAVLTQRAAEYRADGDHLGPRVGDAAAERIRRLLLDHSATSNAVIPVDEVVRRHPDGGFELAPAVFVLDDPRDRRLGLELPFPLLWVAPWTPADGSGLLGDALVVNAVTEDRALIDTLAQDATIRNLYIDVSTAHSDGELPHEGFVGDFLMRNTAVVGAAGFLSTTTGAKR